MADVKWIKITTDIFDDDKILLIESLPEADSIIVIWFKLLCLAGKQNNSGVFIMGERIAYTDKMLATIFRRKESTVQLALQTFEQFGMIELIDGIITIPNWGRHQSLDQMENKKEYMRKYMQEYREKQKRILGNNKLCENGLPFSEWSAILDFFNHECAYCGAKEGLEQEHIIPVNDGGTYRIGNIVPSCRSCNASKGSKSVDGWYANSDVFNEDRFQKLNEYRCKTNIKGLHKANVRQADKIRLEEDKKEKKKENNKATASADAINSYTDYEPLRNAVNEFVKMRKTIKAPLTDHALKLMLNKLDKLSTNDDIKILILNQSIANCWKGIYELKEDYKGGGNNGFNKNEYGKADADSKFADWQPSGGVL